MAVSVRLHDRTDRYRFADMMLDGMKIFPERFDRNLSPGASIKNQRTALRYLRHFRAWSVHVADYSDAGTRRSHTGVPIVTAGGDGFLKSDRLTRRLPIKNSP